MLAWGIGSHSFPSWINGPGWDIFCPATPSKSVPYSSHYCSKQPLHLGPIVYLLLFALGHACMCNYESRRELGAVGRPLTNVDRSQCISNLSCTSHIDHSNVHFTKVLSNTRLTSMYPCKMDPDICSPLSPCHSPRAFTVFFWDDFLLLSLPKRKPECKG